MTARERENHPQQPDSCSLSAMREVHQRRAGWCNDGVASFFANRERGRSARQPVASLLLCEVVPLAPRRPRKPREDRAADLIACSLFNRLNGLSSEILRPVHEGTFSLRLGFSRQRLCCSTTGSAEAGFQHGDSVEDFF